MYGNSLWNGYSRYRCFYEEGKDRPEYIQSIYKKKETGNHLYIPANFDHDKLEGADTPIYFTEGEKKSLRAYQEGLLCIGLSGLWNWKKKDEGLIPDFDKINFKDRKVFIVPDNDYKLPDKHGYEKNLEQAVSQFASALVERGATVYAVELPDGPAKGLDDFLCSQSIDEFYQLPSKDFSEHKEDANKKNNQNPPRRNV